MKRNQWIRELHKITQGFKTKTILNVKLSVGPDGIEVINARVEDTKFLNYIGNSESCLLEKEYADKFVETYGRLTRKGKKNVQPS